MGAKEQWECDRCQDLQEAEKCCDGDDAETYNNGLNGLRAAQ